MEITGLVYPNYSQTDPNSTHFPILAAMVSRTANLPYVTLELGMGHYSTPLLHFMCKALDKRLFSVDNCPEWHDFFLMNLKKYDTHEFFYAKNKLLSTWLKEQNIDDLSVHFDVAFIDHSPALDRVKCVEFLRKRAMFIVVHDSEAIADAYSWNGIFDTFKYKFSWGLYNGNETTVVSEFEEIGLG